MNTSRYITIFTMLIVLSLGGNCVLNAQSQYENPWGMAKPAQTQNLAFERYPVEGFAWPTSVLPGDTIRFYVSVINLEPQSPLSQQYEMKIFRSPDFGTGQEVYSFPNATGHFYPLRDANGDSIFPGQTNRRPVDYKIGCKDFWAPASRTLTIPGNWPSGLYYVRLNHLALNVPSEYYYIPFVVRASQPGQATKILFKYESNTFQAYNYWGGGSLYSLSQDPNTLTSDSIIAFDRPVQRVWSQSATYFVSSFEKTLRDSGYSMEYCDNTDLDRIGLGFGLDLLSNYKMLVLWNHDEYWSTNERNNIESFKGMQYHGNIARFAPNTCYWRINWEGGESGQHRRLKCLKDNYPSGNHPPYDLWRYPTAQGGPGRPEAKFLGSQYQWGWNDINADPLTEQPPDRVFKPAHWIFKNAKLTTVGQEFGFGIVQNGRRKGIVSGELDNTITNRADFPLDTLAQRNVYSHIEQGVRDSVLHQMVYYEDTLTNARVFAQGASGWILGLVNEPGSIDTDVVRMKTITINIISHFSGKKYIGKVYTRFDNALVWDNNIELDGDVAVPLGRYLVSQNNTVTVNNGVTLYVDGTLEINGSVTFSGRGTVKINPGGTLLLKRYSTLTILPTAYFVLENGGNIVFEDNSTLVVNGATVEPGATLAIGNGGTLRVQPGGTISMGSNSVITVQGTLIAQGTESTRIRFVPKEDQRLWSGIVLRSSTSKIEYCDIVSVSTGLSVENSAPAIRQNLIEHCNTGIDVSPMNDSNLEPVIEANEIRNCKYGVYLHQAPRVQFRRNRIHGNAIGLYAFQTNPLLKHNIIEDNRSFGVYSEQADPRFGDYIPEDKGCNTLRNNGREEWGADLYANGGNPFLGFHDGTKPFGGFNSIYKEGGEGRCVVRADKGAYVLAHGNWWGQYPPDERLFCMDEAKIDYSHALMEAPGDCEARIAEWALPRDEEERVLATAAVERGRRNYTAAIETYSSFVATRPNSAKARRALRDVRNTYRHRMFWSGDPTVQNQLVSYLATVAGNHPNTPVKKTALMLLAEEYQMQGDWNNAISRYQQLRQMNPNTPYERTALFALFSIYAYRYEDTASAGSILQLLRTKYPQDPHTELAEFRYASLALSGSPPSAHAAPSAPEEENGVPKKYALEQNFPNPFNPTTEIWFKLGADGYITLRLYDVLGREIKTLAEGQYGSGYHNVTVDASGMSSGVYFYRLATPQYTSVRKMLVAK